MHPFNDSQLYKDTLLQQTGTNSLYSNSTVMVPASAQSITVHKGSHGCTVGEVMFCTC